MVDSFCDVPIKEHCNLHVRFIDPQTPDAFNFLLKTAFHDRHKVRKLSGCREGCAEGNPSLAPDDDWPGNGWREHHDWPKERSDSPPKRNPWSSCHPLHCPRAVPCDQGQEERYFTGLHTNNSFLITLAKITPFVLIAGQTHLIWYWVNQPSEAGVNQ